MNLYAILWYVFFNFKLRDLKKMYYKLEYVIIPRCSADSEKQLRDWDLWGPLLITLGICM